MAQPDDRLDDRLDDEDYPAYTMGRAAEIIGVSPDFLRRIGDLKLITPLRSAGGHRRYSRYQLRLATRARGTVRPGHRAGSGLPHHHPRRPTRRSAPTQPVRPDPLNTSARYTRSWHLP